MEISEFSEVLIPLVRSLFLIQRKSKQEGGGNQQLVLIPLVRSLFLI